ncbi:MFS transporter [Herminiimonas sp. KBW02]|uniref:YbfB/YjiJ family MFS transporter n=1 Tax=Herminiimonas sp. KBW02 TaxID=2153363 RepID=UPI000F5A94A6|nr:YbfB/YjiJ family MFS transporter [Herminiimonas sp. KBW02]RQO36359.1 MFS transporter [Herminiimonas sp. KBW02]
MPSRSDLPAIAVGTTATLAAIGLARLAYTPLLPAVIHEGWFHSSQAVYLGAANLLGYLLGALLAVRLPERFDTRKLLGLSFVAIALSFILCALPEVFSWFFVWRFISGLAGGLLMVIGPSVALTAIPPERRSAVASFVFTGIGMGAILSASMIPMLLRLNLSAAWLVLGLLAIGAGLLADWGMRRIAIHKASVPVQSEVAQPVPALSLAALLVVLAYGLDAIGFIPHTVFWVDFLDREKSLGTDAASMQWLLFGIGAIIGPLLAGYLGKRFGWHRSLALGFFIKAAAIAIPLLSITLFWRSASSLIVGTMVTGLVTLTSGRVMELVGPAAYKRVWGIGAVSFSSAQALSAYGMSALYGVLGTYLPLFAIGSLFMASGCLLLMLTPRSETKPATTIKLCKNGN